MQQLRRTPHRRARDDAEGLVAEAHAEHGARPGTERTVVHLLRHGEVDNPHKVLYGRLPDYHLSPLGREMAEVVGEHLADADLALVVHSPLERTAETAAPTLERHGLTAVVDPRVIEAGNKFEGRRFRKRLLLDPRRWWWLRDPTKPTWGEHYRAIGKRMMAAIEDARDHARGREVLIVSHQLPIWMARSAAEGTSTIMPMGKGSTPTCSITRRATPRAQAISSGSVTMGNITRTGTCVAASAMPRNCSSKNSGTRRIVRNPRSPRNGLASCSWGR